MNICTDNKENKGVRMFYGAHQKENFCGGNFGIKRRQSVGRRVGEDYNWSGAHNSLKNADCEFFS
jgi:hypothetical protein